MTAEKGKDFCIECRKETEYMLQKRKVRKKTWNKEYFFDVTIAVCTECAKEIGIAGLLDKNVQEMDEQYRAIEGIVTVQDIEKLMKVYKIDKVSLSLVLGFSEITIPRYLKNQIPSKEHSDIMKAVLTSPTYMKEQLIENREKFPQATYQKTMAAADRMEHLLSLSEKMLGVISYVLEKRTEVTPLMLQKLLYFIQGIHSSLYGRPIFKEDCRAWIHGPVYPEVYDLFKDFKYNPIDDSYFALLGGSTDKLTEAEKKTINLVINTFGVYDGKVLETITHHETPWQDARKGYEDSIPSSELLPKEEIMEYYTTVNHQYKINTEEGLKNYVHDMLYKADDQYTKL